VTKYGKFRAQYESLQECTVIEQKGDNVHHIAKNGWWGSDAGIKADNVIVHRE